MRKNGVDYKRTVQVMGVAYHKIQELQEQKASFNVISTNMTKKIDFLGKSQNLLYTPNYFKPGEFQLFSQVKDEVSRNIKEKGLKVPPYTEEHVKFFDFAPNLNKAMDTPFDWRDLWEYDIEKAYYRCAYKLGYISREFYLKCLELPKKTRLRLMGSIATYKRIFEYRNGKLIGTTPHFNAENRHAWFHICYVVDSCLREMVTLLGDKYLFYWVDGIYVKDNEGIESILRYMHIKYGFEFTQVEVKRMYNTILRDTTVLNIEKVDKGEEKHKKFYVEKSRTLDTYIHKFGTNLKFE